MHTESSSRRASARRRVHRVGALVLGLCAVPGVATAIPPPELAAAVVSDLLILLGAAASAAAAWFFSVRADDPDGPARRAWRQLGALVAFSLLVTGALVARHRAIDRERTQAPLFRDVLGADLTGDPGLPPSAVSHTGLHELLGRPDPPALVDLRFEREEPVPADAPHLDPLVRAEIIHLSPAELRADPELLRGHDQPPILVCWTGETSSELAATLARRGIATRYLAGGLTTLPSETGSRQRFTYPGHDRLLGPAEAEALLADGARLTVAARSPAVDGAVVLSALETPREVLSQRLAELPSGTAWLGACADRRSCYDAEVLGEWMTEAGHTWLGRVPAAEEVGDHRPPRLATLWATLPAIGGLLFLGVALRRRRPSAREHPRLVEAGDDAGPKAARLALLLRAGAAVPDGLVVLPGAPPPDPTALKRLGDAFAVRSSAPDEDGDTSAAGRYRTELRVSPGDVPDAIERVRGSMPAGGAVLVQVMVDARASGVMFTRGPGTPAFLAVEWGTTADGVTSGHEATGARVSRLDGSVVRGQLPGGLDGGDLLALALRVEALLGPAQDVEWALADGGLVVLQTRPITAGLADAPAVEAERARVLGDVPPDAEPDAVRWRQQRVGEALPRPTPLALDLLREIWSREGAMGRAHVALGLPVSAALDPLDGAPRLQSLFGALVLVAPETASGGTSTPPLGSLLDTLESALPPALARLGDRDRTLPLTEQTPLDHAHTLLSWWDEIAREDHLPLAMVAVAAQLVPGEPPRAAGEHPAPRRSLVDLTPSEGSTPAPPAPLPAPTIDRSAPLAGLLALRDAIRAHVQAATEPLRHGLAALDARLGLDGTIGWLHRDELLLAVDDPDAARDRARARQRRAADLGHPLLPPALTPRQVENLGGEAPAPVGGLWLTPPAELLAPVRVLASPGDLAALQPGEILVAGFAEVGWAAGLDRAAAIVVQVGGALSHLAILCREQGVPAISGVALGRVRTGDRLRLGAAGVQHLPPETP